MPLDETSAEEAGARQAGTRQAGTRQAGTRQTGTADATQPVPSPPAGPRAPGSQLPGGHESSGRNRAAREGSAAPGRRPAAVMARAGEPDRTASLSDSVTWLIAASVAAVYTVISVFRYLRRDPTSWDLGIFTEYVKQYAHLRAPIVDIKGGGFDLLGDHFHPIVAVLAPFFRVFPTPVTLLVAQALLAAVSVLPVSQLGRELLGRAQGRSVAAAYGLSWGLQQMANYDFHEIAFAVPLLAFSLSAMVRGRTRAAVLWALPLVFVKEDQGFTLLAIGLIMGFGYRRHGAGLVLECWGLFWSLLAIFVLIPHFNPQHSYPYWGEAGSFDPVSGHFTISGMWSTLSDGASTKLPTLAMILLPTAFIALRSPVVLAAVPSLALRAVNTTPAYWGTDWHYNATVMPIVFIAAIDAIARIRARKRGSAGLAGGVADGMAGGVADGMSDGLPMPAPAATGEPSRLRLAGRLAVAAERHGAAAMLAICAALAFQFPIASLWTPATYARGPHVAAENRAMALVPDGATVSTDLDLLAPLAARTDTYWLGRAAVDPATEYVVFDTESTDWQPPPPNVLGFVEQLEHRVRYRQIYSSDGVFVFRRAG